MSVKNKLYKSAIVVALGASLNYALPNNSYAGAINQTAPVTNTVPQNGNCHDAYDNDGDGFTDKQDEDCYVDGIYVPTNSENKKQTRGVKGKKGKKEKKTLEITPGRIDPEKISGSAGFFGGQFNSKVSSTQSGSQSVSTEFKGPSFGGYIIFQLFDNGTVRVVPYGSFLTVNAKGSNSTYGNLGKLDATSFRGGVAVPVYIKDGKYTGIFAVGYQGQTMNYKINPGSINLNQEAGGLEFFLEGSDEFIKNNTKFGPKIFMNPQFNSIKQSNFSKQVVEGNYGAGMFVETNGFRGDLTAGIAQYYDAESNKTESGFYVGPRLRFGNNSYVSAEGTISSLGNSAVVGFGQEKLLGKWPVGLSLDIYYQNTKNNTPYTKVENTNFGGGLSIKVNNQINWGSKTLSPSNLIRLR